jgi:hypothetical protein
LAIRRILAQPPDEGNSASNQGSNQAKIQMLDYVMFYFKWSDKKTIFACKGTSMTGSVSQPI